MATLKAGKYDDIAAGMAQFIEDAMVDEWSHRYGEPLPEEGLEDRRILFKAIARGVLGYLENHQGDIRTTTNGVEAHDHTLQFEVSDT